MIYDPIRFVKLVQKILVGNFESMSFNALSFNRSPVAL